MLSAHCGAIRLVKDVQQAPSPCRQWDERHGGEKKVVFTEIQLCGFQQEMGRGCTEMVYSHTPTQASHAPTDTSTHTILQIGNLTKNPVARKALFSLKEKHTTQLIVCP